MIYWGLLIPPNLVTTPRPQLSLCADGSICRKWLYYSFSDSDQEMAYVHHNLPLCILTLGDGHFCHMKLGVWIFGGKYLWLLVSNLHFFSSCLHLSSMLRNHHWPYLRSPIGSKGWKIHIMLKIQINWVKLARQDFENISALQFCVCECIYIVKIDISQFADDLLK